jgi:hypothetical protein
VSPFGDPGVAVAGQVRSPFGDPGAPARESDADREKEFGEIRAPTILEKIGDELHKTGLFTSPIEPEKAPEGIQEGLGHAAGRIVRNAVASNLSPAMLATTVGTLGLGSEISAFVRTVNETGTATPEAIAHAKKVVDISKAIGKAFAAYQTVQAGRAVPGAIKANENPNASPGQKLEADAAVALPLGLAVAGGAVQRIPNPEAPAVAAPLELPPAAPREEINVTPGAETPPEGPVSPFGDKGIVPAGATPPPEAPISPFGDRGAITPIPPVSAGVGAAANPLPSRPETPASVNNGFPGEARPGGGGFPGTAAPIPFQAPPANVQPTPAIAGLATPAGPVTPSPNAAGGAPAVSAAPVDTAGGTPVGEYPANFKAPVPFEESLGSIDSAMAYRAERLANYRKVLADQIGLTDDQVDRLTGLLARDADTDRFEKSLNPDQKTKFEAFFDGPLNQKGGPLDDFIEDRQFDPTQIAKSNNKTELADAVVKSIGNINQAPDFAPSDRFLYPVVALRRLGDIGGSYRDIGDALLRKTGRIGAGDDTEELATGYGKTIKNFADKYGIEIPLEPPAKIAAAPGGFESKALGPATSPNREDTGGELVPPEAPTEAEAAAAPLTEPEVPAELPSEEEPVSVEQLRQEGLALSPRDVERTTSRISAIDQELKAIDKRHSETTPRMALRRIDLNNQRDALRLERLQRQGRLGDPDAEAALHRYQRFQESDGARQLSPEAVTIQFLKNNPLPSTKIMRALGKGGGVAGDVEAMDIPKAYRLGDVAAKNRIVKYLAASGGNPSESQSKEAQMKFGSLSRWAERLAQRLMEEGYPEFQELPSGDFKDGEAGVLDMVNRAIRAEAAGDLKAETPEIPVLPLKQTPQTAAADRLRSQRGAIYIPNLAKIRETKVGYSAEKGVEFLNSERKKLVGDWRAGENKRAMSVGIDAADTAAKLYGRQNANDFRGPIERTYGKEAPVAKDALGFTVEAGIAPRRGQLALQSGPDIYGKDALRSMRAKLVESTRARPYWKKRGIDAIDFALKNYEYISSLVPDFVARLDAQINTENAAGMNVPYFERYLPHQQDVNDPLEGPSIMKAGGAGASSSFKKERVFKTNADSIAAGVDPKDLDATNLLEHRLTNGAQMVNERAWVETLKDMVDPTNGHPIAHPLTSAGTAPAGYHAEMLAGTQFAVQNGYSGIFEALTRPSYFAGRNWGRVLQKGFQAGKSTMLLFDTYHAGRMAFWNANTQGPLTGMNSRGFLAGIANSTFRPPGYKRGVSLLDYSNEELAERAKAAQIPQRYLKGLIQDKAILEGAVRHGFNVGRISDAMHQEWVRKIPIIGRFNKWVFEELTRGALAESYLVEFKRAKAASPNLSDDQIHQKTAHDLNIRFGSLGRQSFIKSATLQDLSRFMFNAPQWNMSLINSELGGGVQLVGTAARAMMGRRIATGLLGRSLIGSALALLAVAEIINWITRGKPTWKNQEEGFGAKISGFIPDLIGRAMGHEGPGFFFNPMALTAEITHLILQKYERDHDWGQVLTEYLASRASAGLRPLVPIVTGRDNLGRALRPGTRVSEALREAPPWPIAAPTLANVVQSLYTHKEVESFPGQDQKQLMQSFGMRTDQAPSQEQRIYGLAADYNRQHGIVPDAEFYSGNYTPIIHALQTGNAQDATEAMPQLLKTTTAKQAFDHLTRWPLFPFTGQAGREAAFKATLNPEELATYNQAVQNRIGIAREALGILHQVDAQAPHLSGPEFNRLMTVMEADKASSLERAPMHSEASAELDRILALPPAQRGPEIERMQQNPELAEAVNRQFEARTRGLSVIETHIKALPVENGARARFIIREAAAIPPGPDRDTYLSNLRDKDILTQPVENQIDELIAEPAGR